MKACDSHSTFRALPNARPLKYNQLLGPILRHPVSGIGVHAPIGRPHSLRTFRTIIAAGVHGVTSIFLSLRNFLPAMCFVSLRLCPVNFLLQHLHVHTCPVPFFFPIITNSLVGSRSAFRPASKLTAMSAHRHPFWFCVSHENVSHVHVRNQTLTTGQNKVLSLFSLSGTVEPPKGISWLAGHG